MFTGDILKKIEEMYYDKECKLSNAVLFYARRKEEESRIEERNAEYWRSSPLSYWSARDRAKEYHTQALIALGLEYIEPRDAWSALHRGRHEVVRKVIVYECDTYTPEDARKMRFSGPMPEKMGSEWDRIGNDTLRRNAKGKLIGGHGRSRAKTWRSDARNVRDRLRVKAALYGGDEDGMTFRTKRVRDWYD